jgi:hypothetical protein
LDVCPFFAFLWAVDGGGLVALSSPGGFLLESKDLPGYFSLLRVFSRWGLLIELRGLDLLLACSFAKVSIPSFLAACSFVLPCRCSGGGCF